MLWPTHAQQLEGTDVSDYWCLVDEEMLVC